MAPLERLDPRGPAPVPALLPAAHADHLLPCDTSTYAPVEPGRMTVNPLTVNGVYFVNDSVRIRIYFEYGLHPDLSSVFNHTRLALDTGGTGRFAEHERDEHERRNNPYVIFNCVYLGRSIARLGPLPRAGCRRRRL